MAKGTTNTEEGSHVSLTQEEEERKKKYDDDSNLTNLIDTDKRDEPFRAYVMSFPSKHLRAALLSQVISRSIMIDGRVRRERCGFPTLHDEKKKEEDNALVTDDSSSKRRQPLDGASNQNRQTFCTRK